ncbi:MAG: galactokinase [Sphingobacterium sp.]|jgi:galactokinase|uniref:galactokinase n=1 Tax=unclassified Sphingobacterium TaxID=2609468 RepID=UPI000987A53A|nr:galactokinase [Sphingobacterium sp. CZ-UAM]MDF2516864.1 galactokinase [Sphingobacterium sp.]OOG17530.1 galactokinase [Sphingobacterium sp. CZ-UAM]
MIAKETIVNKFKSLYQEEPLVVSSPGRINIIGEHTDYNDGFVLPAAIDKAIYVAVSRRADDNIVLYAEDYQERHEVKLSEIAISEKHWPNYILGVVDQYQKRGAVLGGFNLYIDGDVPLGAGLSSSAAVECAVTLALSELFELKVEQIDIPQIAQKAEHTYAGVMCGIMDQFASAFGKEKNVIKLDCRSLGFEYVPLDLKGYEVVLLNTNVKHSLASTAYNTRREQCEQASSWVRAQYPQVKNLRDVTVDMLDELVKDKDADIYAKASFVVRENERVEKSCEALRSGDIAQLGQYIFQSHEGLSQVYEVSCPELDYLVDYVKQFPEVIGARMMGGGFGGCTINIVKEGAVTSILPALEKEYQQKFDKELSVIQVEIANGTRIL